MIASNCMLRLLSAALLSLAFASVPATAAELRHDLGDSHGAVPASLALSDGTKWQTDAPLRQGMENIRRLMQAAMRDIHGNKLPADGYGVLAEKLHAEVEGIMANCRLEPKADAQLHLITADILAGAEALADEAKKRTRQAGAIYVVVALEEYGATFDHPGWPQPRH